MNKFGLGVILFTAMALHMVPYTSAARRISDYNTIGWMSGFGHISMTPKTSLWIEYQYRRDKFGNNWQQSLARTGIQHRLNNGVGIMAGYGYIISFPYGEYPVSPHPIPEHRIFQQLTWNDKMNRIQLDHRIRLEQRFGGKASPTAGDRTITDWIYTNRARYQLRSSVPLNKPQQTENTLYAAVFNEIFIGFGKNVNQNVFDQNRIGLLLGYQFSSAFRLEGGYLNQTLQQGALVNNNAVFQYNNGLLLNAYFNY
jgi:hypothetical protein